MLLHQQSKYYCINKVSTTIRDDITTSLDCAPDTNTIAKIHQIRENSKQKHVFYIKLR